MTLMLGKIEGKRRRGQQRMRWLNSISESMDMNLNKLQETVGTGKPGKLQFLGLPRVGHNLATEQQQYYLLNHFLLSEQIKKLRGKEAITG